LFNKSKMLVSSAGQRARALLFPLTPFLLALFIQSADGRRFVQARAALVSQPTDAPSLLHDAPPSTTTIAPILLSPAEGALFDLRRRQANPTVAALDGYTHLGCYQDGSDNILGVTSKYDNGMTPELCRNVCSLASVGIFGVENGYQCYCDSTIANFAVTAPAAECTEKCWGSSAALCGGGRRINVYSATNGQFPAPGAYLHAVSRALVIIEYGDGREG
jgi:hypothetical protein